MFQIFFFSQNFSKSKINRKKVNFAKYLVFLTSKVTNTNILNFREYQFWLLKADSVAFIGDRSLNSERSQISLFNWSSIQEIFDINLIINLRHSRTVFDRTYLLTIKDLSKLLKNFERSIFRTQIFGTQS